MATPLLSIRDLCVSYGNITAVRGISIDVEEGQIVTLIGANGAGKSTTLRAISGLAKQTTGSIKLRDTELTTLAPHSIVEAGIAHVPEGRGNLRQSHSP
jgi:branched-chain amino acid transport system ATP-binding protein